MWVYLSVFVVFSVYNSNFVDGKAIVTENDKGYYWKDFTGYIPKDALPGGKNVNGKTTYIGQVLHANQLIPAKIDPEQGKVYYEWGYKEYQTTQNIKILCTEHPERFEWLNSGNGLLDNLKYANLINGGFEEHRKLYIGRKQLTDELAIGKVISGPTQTTLNTTKDGKGHQHAEFQILAYNAPKTNPGEDGFPTAGEDIVDTSTKVQ